MSAAYSGQAGLERLEVILSCYERAVTQWSGDAGVLSQLAAGLAGMSRSSQLAQSVVGPGVRVALAPRLRSNSQCELLPAIYVVQVE